MDRTKPQPKSFFRGWGWFVVLKLRFGLWFQVNRGLRFGLGFNFCKPKPQHEPQFIYFFKKNSKYTWQGDIEVHDEKNKFEVKNLNIFDKLLFMYNYVGNFVFIWTLI